MLIIDKKYLFYAMKEIHGSDGLFELKGCDYVKFVNCKHAYQGHDFKCNKVLTSVIDLNKDLDEIWHGFSDTNKRYIKRAEKDGVNIFISNDYDGFYNNYKKFVRARGFYPLLGIGLPNLDLIKKHGTIFAAEFNNEILCEEVFFEHDNYIRCWMAASKRFFTDKKKARIMSSANRLLFWEVIKYSKQKGYTEFDWGGLWKEHEIKNDEMKRGLNDYKLSFGGGVTERFNYYKCYSQSFNKIYNLFALCNKVKMELLNERIRAYLFCWLVEPSLGQLGQIETVIDLL